MGKHTPAFSQVSCFGRPQPKTWDDYDQGCELTYGGGYRNESDINIFHHGMRTVFNLLRHEFPPAELCKAAPDLLSACEAALKGLTSYNANTDEIIDQIRAAITKATAATTAKGV